MQNKFKSIHEYCVKIDNSDPDQGQNDTDPGPNLCTILLKEYFQCQVSYSGLELIAALNIPWQELVLGKDYSVVIRD